MTTRLTPSIQLVFVRKYSVSRALLRSFDARLMFRLEIPPGMPSFIKHIVFRMYERNACDMRQQRAE
jgi:hypothetical protein